MPSAINCGVEKSKEADTQEVNEGPGNLTDVLKWIDAVKNGLQHNKNEVSGVM